MQVGLSHVENDSVAERSRSLHRVLKSRAALAGKSLSDYLIAEMQRHAEYPTVEELCQRLHARTPVRPTLPPAHIVREERDGR